MEDFVPLIRALKSLKKEVEIYTFKEICSDALIKNNKFILIDKKLVNKCFWRGNDQKINMTKKSNISFGPAGLGGVDAAVDRLEYYSKKGLKACEIAFTYGIYIKNKQDAIRIGKKARELDIKLSIHAPYWINLDSKEKRKIEESKKRILDCCKVGDWLGAYVVVFHPGYYSDMDKEETYQKIKKAIIEMQEVRKKNKWKPELAPETTGKINVFGSVEETARLKNETNCNFVLDFAHIEARDKKINWEKIRELFPEKKWHCHFSGIEYGEKGERKHKKTGKKNWKKLLENLPKDKEIVIINESPFDVEDSVEGLSLVK